MFFIVGLLLFFSAFFLSSDAYEIQFNEDIYYIVSWSNILTYLGFFCCLVGAIYYLLRSRYLSVDKRLKGVHLMLTLLGIILFFYSQHELIGMRGIPRRYFMVTDVSESSSIFKLGVLSIILFCIGQVVFIVGIYKGIRKAK